MMKHNKWNGHNQQPQAKIDNRNKPTDNPEVYISRPSLWNSYDLFAQRNREKDGHKKLWRN